MRLVLAEYQQSDLYSDQDQSAPDPLQTFIKYCNIAGIGGVLREGVIEATVPSQDKARLCGRLRLERLRKDFSKLPWAVAYQLEALLSNGLLHAGQVEELLPKVRQLCKKHLRNDSAFVGNLLRDYTRDLQTRAMGPAPSLPTNPLKIFDDLLKSFDSTESETPPGTFRCGHVTFTPTRMLLHGPFPTQSNRIIRQYPAFCSHFLRVDFRDEDRLQYTWDRSTDETLVLRERIGGILKYGFVLCGRKFEFLAYSSSALREHSVWFISPFDYVMPSGVSVKVTAQFIRDGIGDFAGTDLMRCPSKYAARLAQAFTATDPSVSIRRENWEMVEDLGKKPYLFTDGVGTISEGLAKDVWNALKDNGRGFGDIVPSAVGGSLLWTRFQN